MRVLIVDDYEINSSILARLVERCGHEPLVADDGFSALELAARFPPDLVLMDIMMPVMDGYETTKRLRSELGHTAARSSQFPQPRKTRSSHARRRHDGTLSQAAGIEPAARVARPPIGGKPVATRVTPSLGCYHFLPIAPCCPHFNVRCSHSRTYSPAAALQRFSLR